MIMISIWKRCTDRNRNYTSCRVYPVLCAERHCRRSQWQPASYMVQTVEGYEVRAVPQMAPQASTQHLATAPTKKEPPRKQTPVCSESRGCACHWQNLHLHTATHGLQTAACQLQKLTLVLRCQQTPLARVYSGSHAILPEVRTLTPEGASTKTECVLELRRLAACFSSAVCRPMKVTGQTATLHRQHTFTMSLHCVHMNNTATDSRCLLTPRGASQQQFFFTSQSS